METRGLRVVRGPDWKCKDQDSGEGGVGTVISSTAKGNLLEKLVGKFMYGNNIQTENISKQPRQIDGMVRVAWDSGIVADYLANNKFHDLRVLDNSLIGVKHLGMVCNNCNKEICGFRWDCTECRAKYCTGCMIRENWCDDPSHNSFNRYDTPTSNPVLVTVNPEKRIKLWGMFTNAKVRRGRHWSYGNEDEGEIGEVKTVEPLLGTIQVQWGKSKQPMLYRRGLNGKMDLRVDEFLTVGGLYEPHWLPVLDIVGSAPLIERKDKNQAFSNGDRVQINKEMTGIDFRNKQIVGANWYPLMNEEIGKTGTICRGKRDESNVLCIEFDESRKKWHLHLAVLDRVDPLESSDCYQIGQIVRVREEMVYFKEMVSNFGNKLALLVSGKTGSILEVTNVGIKISIYGHRAVEDTLFFKPEWIQDYSLLSRELNKLEMKLASLLVEAAKSGDLHVVKHLINQHKVPIDSDYEDGITALHMASFKGRKEVVKYLVSEGADPNKADDKGRQALYFAVKGNRPYVVKFFMMKQMVQVNSVTFSRKLTPLQKAVTKEFDVCAKFILIYDDQVDVNQPDEEGNTPLLNTSIGGKDLSNYAFSSENLFGSEKADQFYRNKQGFNALHAAVFINNFRTVNELLQKGENRLRYETVGNSQTTSLHIACMNKHYESGKALLNPLKWDQWFTPRQNIPKEPELLKLINAKDQNGHSPLMMACYQGAFGLVELLVNEGADIHDVDIDGDDAIIMTALHIKKEAAKVDQTSTFRQIIWPFFHPMWKRPDGIKARKSEAPEIYKIYNKYREFGNDHPMIKYPALSVICFLINKGCKWEGEKKSKVIQILDEDSTIHQFLESCISTDYERNDIEKEEANNLFACHPMVTESYVKRTIPSVPRMEMLSTINKQTEDTRIAFALVQLNSLMSLNSGLDQDEVFLHILEEGRKEKKADHSDSDDCMLGSSDYDDDDYNL